MCVIYKTTNLVNKKIYIGKDVRNRKSYLGSGKVLKQAIIKYGEKNFKKEILEECSRDILSDREKFWIDVFKSFNPEIGYNLTKGGDGGDTFTNHPDKIQINRKRSKSLKGKLSGDKNPARRLEVKQKISMSLKLGYASGRIKVPQLFKKNNSNTGRKKGKRPPVGQETRKKLSEATKKRWGAMSLEEKNAIIQKIVQKTKGRVRTKEQNQQNSQRQILRFSNPENRKKASLSQKRRFSKNIN